MYKVLFVDALNQFCLPFVFSISLFLLFQLIINYRVDSVQPSKKGMAPDSFCFLAIVRIFPSQNFLVVLSRRLFYMGFA